MLINGGNFLHVIQLYIRIFKFSVYFLLQKAVFNFRKKKNTEKQNQGFKTMGPFWIFTGVCLPGVGVNEWLINWG